MKKVFKAHPLMIMRTVQPFLLIWILPFVKATLQYYIKGKITNIIGIEPIIFGIVTVIAILRWLSVRIIISDGYVRVNIGFLFKTKAKIDVKNLSSVQIVQNPFDLLLRSVTVNINTEAGLRDRPDFKLKLWKKDAKTFAKSLYKGPTTGKVKFSSLRMAVMAAATSSAFSGMVLVVPVINRAGKLLGLGIEKLINEIETASSKIETYFPPIVNTITLVFLLCFAISFVYSFIRYLNFKLYLGEDRIEVHSGLIVRTNTAFRKSSVNNVMIIQTPLMFLIKRFALKVSVGGFGETGRESQIIVPAGRYKDIKSDFSEYFPFLVPDTTPLTARRNLLQRSRFVFWPMLCFIFLVPTSIVLAVLFKDLGRFILFVTAIALVIIFYYAYLGEFEYKYGKIQFGKNISARSTKGAKTCRLYCPVEKVGQIKLTRYIPDLYYRTCRVTLTVCSEHADSIRVRHLDRKEVIKNIEECFGINVY